MKNVAPVLVIFFNRPETLQLVFNEVRKAKPNRLYFFQDGARENNQNDIDKIQQCRKIVENIDWDCDVFRNYQEKNNGCGIGPKKAIDWLFDNENEGIILEDDCVASQSFFSFCTEMLYKYKQDERIFLITGCNFELKTLDIQFSYFFGYAGTNWGWATWKRNWVRNDYSCTWINDEKIKNSVQNTIKNINKTASKIEIADFERTNKLVNDAVNISYWDVQWQSTRYLNHQLSIIPSINLITNIGLGLNSTHAQSASIPQELYSDIGKIHFCYNERYELENALVHPRFMVENIEYDKKIYKALYKNTFIKLFNRAKNVLKRFIYKF